MFSEVTKNIFIKLMKLFN